MKNIKTIFSKILITTSLLTLGITGASASNLEFSDVGGRDDTKAIEFLKQQNIVKGYENNGVQEYKPEQKISRAEFLKILLETSVAEKKSCTKTEVQNIHKIFSDVSSEEWFAEYICTGFKSGFVNGYPDKTFKPHAEISLAEASKIISLVQELKIDTDTSTGSASEGEWFAPFLKTLNNEKAVKQNIQNLPAEKISRGDMADMIWRITTGNEIFPENSQNIPQEILSCDALETQIKKANKRSGNYRNFGNRNRYFRTFEEFDVQESIMNDSVPTAMMKKSMSTESVSASDDFSSTNIQEAGVDEADIIKNDGSHIFSARGEDVKIVRAYPVSEMKEESTIKVENMRITELFLENNTLILLGQKTHNYTSQNPEISTKMIAPDFYYGNSGIEVRIFDVSDRKNPKQIRSVSLDGNLVSSRRVGETLYLVANNYLRYNNFNPEILPLLRDSQEINSEISKTSIAPNCGNIQYFPNFSNSNLTTIAAINTKNPSQKITLKNFLGAGENIYSSPENLYVVRNSSEQVFTDTNGVAKWGWKNFSVISKIGLDAQNISFDAQGKVEGRVLNQYSMSEFEGNFRIATHQNADWRAGTENLSSNNVFILDKNLNKTGEIRNIAKGENIKSVRFMGKRGFVVTFKSVDPLFVIDMNPSNPKIVGELKIPGWSDYLHPIDENYIIGFGKEVNAESANKERLTWDMLMGMKLAIFDVSDLKNPKEIHKIIIGDRGTTSEILHNPRALFYDAQRQLIGFPVQINKNSTQENGYETSKTVFSGAHIYKFSVESGFSKLGEVSHFPSSAFNTQNFWDQNYKISRIVRIGENFYSSSKGLITGLSSTMTPEKTVSFMGTKNCSEISDANTCEASQLCKATYTMPKCPEGQFCIQMMQFDKCVLK